MALSVTTTIIMITIVLIVIPLSLFILHLTLRYREFKTLSNLEFNPSQVIRHAEINDIKITDCEIRSIGE